jgi:hypothetical protein
MGLGFAVRSDRVPMRGVAGGEAALLHGGALGRNSVFDAVIMRGERTVPDRAHAYD